MIKNIYKLIACGTLLLMIAALSSCKDYLDRSPEAEVSSTDAFISFNNFQGFVEELYSSVPDYTIYTWACDWILGDEILNKVGGIWVNDEMDKGNSWVWDSWISWLSAADIKTDGDTGKGLWSNAWYAIRKANLGLENMENLTDATPEQRDIIKGQLLFFRAFYPSRPVTSRLLRASLVQCGQPFRDSLSGDSPIYQQKKTLCRYKAYLPNKSLA